ncbi:MAG: DinB family protein [Bacteroidetes bacterium]|nr:DinB family protein [Bacteroidota bacterium]MBS1631755.1 DinB family protein [Bacteroidota bacterium]
MEIKSLAAQHICEVLKGNWSDIFLEDVLQDVTLEEAKFIPPSKNSIAMLAHHIKFYNEAVLFRVVKDSQTVNYEANGFDVPELKTEVEWQHLKEATLSSFTNLADKVLAMPEEQLFELTPSGIATFYKTLHGVTEHAYYHMGQIVVIKKIFRNK